VLKSKSNQLLCTPCQLAKSRKLPFCDSSHVTSAPLELIHSDVWTSTVLSTNGDNFYIIFVDDFSRYTWLVPLKHKSDALEQFVKFKCLTENLFSQKIKKFQTVGGGEYTSSAFSKFLADHGIFHRTTCPHTSQQNGIGERKHRHIIETGLSLLAQSHLPPKFWVDACHTVVYLINRMPIGIARDSPATREF
jgi:transposase InsO family protein